MLKVVIELNIIVCIFICDCLILAYVYSSIDFLSRAVNKFWINLTKSLCLRFWNYFNIFWNHASKHSSLIYLLDSSYSFFPFMNPFHVLFQIWLYCKSSVTTVAFVVLLLLMNCFNVTIQNTICSKPCVTDIAFESLLSFMNNKKMASQHGISCKSSICIWKASSFHELILCVRSNWIFEET